MTSQEQYAKAIGVLDEAGGTWQGVGMDEWYILVSPRQYEFLVAAKVVDPKDAAKDNESYKNMGRSATAQEVPHPNAVVHGRHRTPNATPSQVDSEDAAKGRETNHGQKSRKKAKP
jgi:hypothetical protein